MAEVNPNPNPNPEPTPQPTDGDGNVLGKFEEIRENYETKLSEKDKEIEDLRKQLAAKDKEVDETINNLKGEVDDKLAKAEELKKLQKTVEELQRDKAETTVDNLIELMHCGILSKVKPAIVIQIASFSLSYFRIEFVLLAKNLNRASQLFEMVVRLSEFGGVSYFVHACINTRLRFASESDDSIKNSYIW
jgi:hypothetical protein